MRKEGEDGRNVGREIRIVGEERKIRKERRRKGGGHNDGEGADKKRSRGRWQDG